MSQEAFLSLFRDPVFVNLDEKKERPPLHSTDLQVVLKNNLDGRSGAYFSVNGFGDFDKNPSRKKALVTALNGHFVEIDAPSKPVHQILNDAAVLADECGIPFTCLVATGRGVHGYWIFKEPVLNPSDDQKQAYESNQDALTEMFDGDIQARDMARILRIPGSKYWKDGSGKEIRIGTITANRYTESDFNGFPRAQRPVANEKSAVPMESIMYAKHGERHGKSYRLALKICNQFGDASSRSVAHQIYRSVIDNQFERVLGDAFHDAGGEADQQFELAWKYILANPKSSKSPTPSAESTTVFRPACSFTQLMSTAFPEPLWVVEKMFAAGTINMISAPPNHFKSWVILEIALAAAKGAPLFGTFSTTKQSVIIVNEEDNARMIQQRIAMLGEQPADLPIYFHIEEGIKLTDAHVENLLLEAKEKRVTMIIFDSLRSVHDGEENSSQEMQAVMDQLKRFTQAGITVLFTHHNRKRVIGDTRNDGEETRGSSGINAAVHGHLSLYSFDEKGEKFIVVRQPKLKAEEKIKPFELLITTSPWGFSYRAHDENARTESRVSDKIMDALASENKWFSVDDLMGFEVGGASSIRFALKVLEEQHYVEKKTRKVALGLGLEMKSPEGSLNQNVYRIAPDEWPGDEISE